MKITFEFDTDSENFSQSELESYKQAINTTYCLTKIKDQLKEWYNHDSRGSIPITEVYDTINDIIDETVYTKGLDLDY